MVTIADGWCELDNWQYGKAHRIMLHIPRPVGDAALCGHDLRRAGPVTRAGAEHGHRCLQCERAAQAAGVRR